MLDDRTIGFVDFVSNRQYITLGNLAENPKAYLFLIDYADRRRVIEGDPELTGRLMPKDHKARPSQVIEFSVRAWDANCPQHIPRRLEATDVAAALAERDRTIAQLRAQLEQLRLSGARCFQPPIDAVSVDGVATAK